MENQNPKTEQTVSNPQDRGVDTVALIAGGTGTSHVAEAITAGNAAFGPAENSPAAAEAYAATKAETDLGTSALTLDGVVPQTDPARVAEQQAAEQYQHGSAYTDNHGTPPQPN